jgi:hypothetical protein
MQSWNFFFKKSGGDANQVVEKFSCSDKYIIVRDFYDKPPKKWYKKLKIIFIKARHQTIFAYLLNLNLSLY